MRKLILFKSQRDARAVFSVRERSSDDARVYHTQLKTVSRNGDETQYGFGTDFTELRGKFGGTKWDEISWRWNAPEEIKAYFATLTNGVAIA